MTVLERLELGLVTERGVTELDGMADGSQQHLVAVWFHQELEGLRFHRLNRRRDFAISRDEGARRRGRECPIYPKEMTVDLVRCCLRRLPD